MKWYILPGSIVEAEDERVFFAGDIFGEKDTFSMDDVISLIIMKKYVMTLSDWSKTTYNFSIQILCQILGTLI